MWLVVSAPSETPISQVLGPGSHRGLMHGGSVPVAGQAPVGPLNSRFWVSPMPVTVECRLSHEPARLPQTTSSITSGSLNVRAASAVHSAADPVTWAHVCGVVPVGVSTRIVLEEPVPARKFCSWLLYPMVETPAGAGSPLLVSAVAVVTLLAIVSLTSRTSGALSIDTPPPSWLDTLSVIVLFDTTNGHGPASRKRTPAPSS